MKITAIECTPFDLPLGKPVTYAGGTLAVSQHVLVEVRTDQGLAGIAEAPSRPFYYGESQASICAAVRDWFEPALRGRSPFELERAWSVFDAVEHNNTAKAAIDIALHDLMGKALGQPCHRLLGGWTDEVRVTYICGYGPPQAMAEEALAMRERHGIDAFKLKVGIDPAQDVKMLHALRRALPDAHLCVDGNSGLSGADAVRVVAAGHEVGLAWAEEPVHPHDRPGRALLARHSRVPIMGDESCRTPQEVARELADSFVQIVGIKTARTGFRVSRDILGQAAALRAPVVIASQGDSTLGIAAGLQFTAAHRAAAARPAELTFHLNMQADILVEPLVVQGGKLRAPAGPGLGVRVDPDKLSRYRAK
jgi:L-alanine-DL-glutamate epimerase-like enolase superfamily enzyme